MKNNHTEGKKKTHNIQTRGVYRPLVALPINGYFRGVFASESICQLFQGAGNSFTSWCKAKPLRSKVFHLKHLLTVDLSSLPLFRQLPLVSVLPPTAAPLLSCQVLLLANRKHLICKLNYMQSPHHSGNNNVLIDGNKKPQDVFVNLVLC